MIGPGIDVRAVPQAPPFSCHVDAGQKEKFGMTETKARNLGWGRFILQLVTVALAYFAFGIPAVAIWGETSTGVATSVATSMLGGLLMALFWLRRDRALGEAWDLRKPKNWPRTAIVAALATIAIIGWFTLGALLVEAIGLDTPDVEQVLAWVTQSRFHFLLWIVLVALFAAGLGEELLWRGFLIDRLERLKGLQGQVWLVILVQGVLFGLPHFYQGFGGVIITAVVGFGFGWLRYRFGGNLWACILAHMAVDTIMMSLSYAGKTGLLPGAG